MAKKQQPKVQLDLWGRSIEPAQRRRTETESVAIFEGESIRCIDIDGRRWWVAVDVCRVLGVTNPTVALDRLDDDEKTLSSTYTQGGKLCLLNEFGLYSLTLTTRLRKNNPSYAKVRRFKRWVCHVVLPEIRATGKYDGTRPKAIDPVAKIQKRLGCDGATAAMRHKSIAQSKASHRELAKIDAKPNDYRDYNNNIYKLLFKRTAPELREVLGQKPGETPLDRMGFFPLAQISYAKALGDKMAELSGAATPADRNKVVEECVTFVRESGFEHLGGPDDVIHAIVEDDKRGRIIDVVRRQLMPV